MWHIYTKKGACVKVNGSDTCTILNVLIQSHGYGVTVCVMSQVFKNGPVSGHWSLPVISGDCYNPGINRTNDLPTYKPGFMLQYHMVAGATVCAAHADGALQCKSVINSCTQHNQTQLWVQLWIETLKSSFSKWFFLVFTETITVERSGRTAGRCLLCNITP